MTNESDGIAGFVVPTYVTSDAARTIIILRSRQPDCKRSDRRLPAWRLGWVARAPGTLLRPPRLPGPAPFDFHRQGPAQERADQDQDAQDADVVQGRIQGNGPHHVAGDE